MSKQLQIAAVFSVLSMAMLAIVSPGISARHDGASGAFFSDRDVAAPSAPSFTLPFLGR